LAELVYKLATWVPQLISDVEGLVYLEVFSRTISEATRVVPPLITSNPEFRDGRIRRLLREIFVPLVLGGIDVDEALLETLPGDHVNLLSIHQAKGLEFPMVCVDVGCDFINNRRGPARRFPRRAGSAEAMEDYFRRFSSLGVSHRDGLDRSFDDLVRKFFVAFTRPQDLLVLVGLGDAQDGPLGNVKNVGTGWTRDESVGSLWSQLPGVVYI
jgi:DNA helicase-2/ATP-dependent DNA helicase PcrA